MLVIFRAPSGHTNPKPWQPRAVTRLRRCEAAAVDIELAPSTCQGCRRPSKVVRMAPPRVSFRYWRDGSERPSGILARSVFYATAAAFAIAGAVTALWISRANIADGFFFGSTGLWSAMDPAGFYIPEVILFFETDVLSVDFHPGLTMLVMAVGLARAVYALSALFAGEETTYIEFWVRHRILLSAMLAALADAMWLACCHPLFKVLRHFMDRSTAYVGCTLFLTSVPVLLYLSRFAAEPWMLYFLLWSIHLSLRALDGEADIGTAVAMGVCTALAVLSKWLAAPIVALNLFSLLRRPNRVARIVLRDLAAYAVAGLLPAMLLMSKLSFSHVAWGMWWQMRDDPGITRTLALPHQRPFVVHNATVLFLGALGLAVIARLRASARRPLAALLATLALMALLLARRPQWHYFFGFFWLFPAAAACGLTLLLNGRVPWRRDVVAVASGIVIFTVCNVWMYPGLIATYGGYRAAYARRAALAKLHPAWVPAPWEVALDGFEATRDPTRVFGYRAQSRALLDPILQRQRQQEDQAVP